MTFTNVWIVDYEGKHHARAAKFIGDANGMGVRSNSRYEGEKPWALDGAEAFTWSADTDVQFTGLELRPGWEAANAYGMKQLAISSPAWRNLHGVRPRSGVQYDPETGTFLINNTQFSTSRDRVVRVEELVGGSTPRLNVPAGVGLTFANAGEVTGDEDFSFVSMSFDLAEEGDYQDIPEPRSYGLILALVGFSMALMRRRLAAVSYLLIN